MILQWALLTFVAVFFLSRPMAAAGESSPGAPREWADLLRAAETEAQVNIAGPPGDAFRAALTDGFRKAYPKMRVELLGGTGRDKVARSLRERQGGLY